MHMPKFSDCGRTEKAGDFFFLVSAGNGKPPLRVPVDTLCTVACETACAAPAQASEPAADCQAGRETATAP
jgi:hypothetical protein